MGSSRPPQVSLWTHSMSDHQDHDPTSSQKYTRITEQLNNQMKKRNIGLTNEINTCFINSSLQCLLNIKQFAQYYLTADPQSMNALNKQITNLVKAMWLNDENTKYRIYNMEKFYKEIVNCFELYSINHHRQMDSPEFIQILLNYIQCHPLKSKTQNKDIVGDLFQGRFHTVITCKQPIDLHYSHLRDREYKIVDIKQKFLTMPLTVLEQSKKKINKTIKKYYFHSYLSCCYTYSDKYENITLQECLKTFSDKITLSNNDGWHCKICQKDAQSQKQMSIFQTGNILIIQLLRFQGETKLDRTIQYPLCLGQRDLIKEQRNDPPIPANYHLIGVICHLGSTIRFGHYTSFTLDEEQQVWYRQSDSSAHQAYQQEYLNNPNAYVLFYRKRQ